MRRDAFEGSAPFEPAQIVQARRTARETGRRVLTVLEENAALSAEAFVASLGRTLNYPTLTMAALNQLEPAFDVMPFSDAVKRECLALRTRDGELIVAFADPFQPGVQEWGEARVGARQDGTEYPHDGANRKNRDATLYRRMIPGCEPCCS